MTYARQLALPFPQADRYGTAELLHADSNAAALAWLARPETWPGSRLALHGEAGSGKTHLLHVFAERHGAALLPGAGVRRLAPLPEAAALAIDDADAVDDARALLHLLNAATEQGLPVLLAGRTPPARWPFTLPDLTSRLRAITAVAVQPPEDSLLRALLGRLTAERQLAVPEPVRDYLLARLPRTGAALREAAARLDHLSLAEGRRVTRETAARVVDSFG